MAKDNKPIYRIVIYNDDKHSMNEVVLTISQAFRLPPELATQLVLAAHSKGNQTVAWTDKKDVADQFATILRKKGFQIEVDDDYNEDLNLLIELTHLHEEYLQKAIYKFRKYGISPQAPPQKEEEWQQGSEETEDFDE